MNPTVSSRLILYSLALALAGCGGDEPAPAPPNDAVTEATLAEAGFDDVLLVKLSADDVITVDGQTLTLEAFSDFVGALPTGQTKLVLESDTGASFEATSEVLAIIASTTASQD